MHILVLPSWYHTEDKPWRGMFFRDQALSIIRSGNRAGVAFVERKSLGLLTPGALLRQRFQIRSEDEGGIPTLRMKGWSTFAQTTPGAMLWARLTERLVDAYVERHGFPDVIHGHGAMWAGYAAMLCARGLNIPYVVTEHASAVARQTISGEDRRMLAEVYRNADAVIAVSNFARHSVNAIAGSSVAHVVPNTIDAEFFKPPSARPPRSPFVFLFVGDLVKSKGVDTLLEAFQSQEGSRLVVVGTGKEESRLKRMVGKSQIEFTGALSRDAVREQMWNAHALVLPSAFETFGVVLVEAMSTGIPVIATRCGGPEEIVTPRSGILVERGSVAELAAAMAAIRTTQFDEQNITAAAARFRYEAIAPPLFAIYRSVTRQRRAA